MKSGPPTPDGRRSAYTLAETLAALLFLAIVIPAAVEALHIAGRAGTVAARRGVAARIAAGVLTESILYTNQNSGSQNGTVSEGPIDYHWTLTRQTWIQEAIPLLTAEVRFSAQGQESLVRVSTLGNPNTNATVSLSR